MAEWRSKVPDLKRQMDRAEREALRSAATVLATAVKEDIADGFTSGAFVGADPVTGPPLEDTVEVSNVRKNKRGRYIKVFTNDVRALFWELGHHNPFTGKFERVEVWRKAFARTRDAIANVYSAALKASVAQQSYRAIPAADWAAAKRQDSAVDAFRGMPL